MSIANLDGSSVSIFFTLAVRNNLKLVVRYIEAYRQKRENELIALTKLYSIDVKGNPRHWSIIVDGDTYYTESGKVGAGYKVTQSKPKRVVEKNVGKVNHITATNQAYIEAKRIWEDRYERGHRTSIDEARSVLDQEPAFFKPMLADKYSDKLTDGNWPVMVQPKLDGIRCVIRREGDKLVARSRNGKVFDTLEYLLTELNGLFQRYPFLVLDGELYNHDYKDDFNKIISLVRKKKPDNPTEKWDETLREARDSIQYWVYDIPHIYGPEDMDTPYHERTFGFIFDAMEIHHWPDCLYYVSNKWCPNHDMVHQAHKEYINAGFEGSMVRIDKGYENGRSKSLLKFKDFQDSEYLVVGIDEGNGNRTGTAKHIVCQDRETGKQFNSNIKGTFEWYKELLDNKDQYIGKLVTVQYANLTPDGIPRFPFAIAFRDYE